MLAERRWTRGQFVPAWLALLVPQVALVWSVVQPEPMLPAPAVWTLVALLQVVKVPITAFRLNDLGRPPDLAPFLALIPVVNVAGAFGYVLRPTPSDTEWTRRRSHWTGQLGPFAAAREGLKLAAATAGVGLPLALVYGLGAALLLRLMLSGLGVAEAADPASVKLASQVLWGVAGFLGLYTFMQYLKRKTVSRASWFPSLFAVPTALIAIAATLVAAGRLGDMGPAILSLPATAAGLLWSSVAGAALAVGHVHLGAAARDGEKMSMGTVLGHMGERTVDVAAPHGAQVHAVTIGIQVVLPGVYYALQLAFVDMVAVLEPDKPALRRSGQLTWGMRSRLFQMFLLWVLVTLGLDVLTGLLLEDTDTLWQSIVDPRVLQLHTHIITQVIWAVTSWWLQMSLLAMYFERLERARARAAEKASAQESPAT